MNQTAKIIKLKLGLLELAEQLGNAQQACKVMGYSRDSYYRFKNCMSKGVSFRFKKLVVKSLSKKNRFVKMKADE